MKYPCCICSAPVGFSRNLYCKDCFKAYSDEEWAIELARTELARRNDERRHKAIPLDLLSEEDLVSATKVA